MEAESHRFWLTARRWTSEQLDAARHTTDLTPGDTVWVNLDHAQHGIGSQSCGPGVLPQHQLAVEPARFALLFSSPASGPGTAAEVRRPRDGGILRTGGARTLLTRPPR